MGNCFSCCVLEPYEYEENDKLITNKIKKVRFNNANEKKSLAYDSSLF